MIKRVLSKLRKVTMSLFAVLCAGAVWAEEGEVTYVTSPMQDPTAGYIRTGLGKKGNEVAVVFTNHTKTATWTVPANLYNVEFLVVGGGGGGGADNNDDVRMAGSGGGGGGVVTGLVNFVEGSIVSATVGKGGEGGFVEKKPGTSSYNYWGAAKLASASTFGVGSDVYVTANAGGRDLGASATSYTSGTNGGSGGSGAGGRQKKNGGAATKGSGDNNFVVFYEAFGNNGGKGATQDWYGGSANSAGGGGGAHPDVSLGAGGDAGWTEEGGWFGGKGGEGLTSNITGFDVVYGSGGGGGNATGLGGVAGEGAGDGNTANISGMGAAYGRGNDALQNQGGGGGGGGRGNGPGYQKRGGGNGGSGIVVFRYSVYEAEVVTAEGSMLYATFAEAFDAAQAGETVKLLNDVTLAEKLTIKKAVTLDLNGCTLSETVTDSYGAIYIGTAGNLTITDSATGGKIATDGGIVVGNYGTVTVAGGTIEAGAVAEEDASVYNFYYNGSTYGKLTVNGGKVVRIWNCGNANITAGEVVDIDNSGAMTIAEAATVSGTVIIKDGSDAADVPGAGTLTAPETLTVQVGNEGYFASYTDGKWVLEEAIDDPFVVNGEHYATFAAAYAAVEDGGEITIDERAEGTAFETPGFVLNKSVTIDLKDRTLTLTPPAVGSTGTETLGIQILPAAGRAEAMNVIIKNGTINVAESNLTAEKPIKMMINNYVTGALTLENVTLDGTNLVKPSNMPIYVLSNNRGTVALTGETSIVAPEGAVAFDVCKYSTYDAPTVTLNTTGTIAGKVEVSGGDFVIGDENTAEISAIDFTAGSVKGNVEEVLAIPEDKKLVEADGVYTLADKDVLAKVGDELFETIAEAFDAAQAGDTVILEKSLAVNEVLQIPANVTLDLNGNELQVLAVVGKLSMNGGALKTWDANTQTYFFMAAPAGALYQTSDAVMTIGADYSLSLDGGSVTLPASWRTLLGQSLTIKSGAAFVIPTGVQLNLRGNAVVEDGATLTCDGTIALGNTYDAIDTSATLTSAQLAEGKVVSAVEGYRPVYANGVYSLEEIPAEFVAQVGAEKYATLQEAINAAAADAVVKLIANTEENITISASFTGTIDLGGYTLTGKVLLENSEAEIRNGAVYAPKGITDKAAVHVSGGNVVLNNLNVTANYHVVRATGAKVKIIGADSKYTCVTNGDVSYYLIYAETSGNNNAEITIENGAFCSDKTKGEIYGLRAKNADDKIFVTGGVFDAEYDNLVNATNGKCEISGGKFKKKSNLESYLADGYKVDDTVNPGYYTVVKSWTAPMPDLEEGDRFNVEYTDAVIAALQGAEGVVGVKVNNVVLKGDEAVKALNDAVACFEDAITIDGTTASLDIDIKVTEVNTENPAASTVVVTRNGVPLTVKATPTVKYFYPETKTWGSDKPESGAVLFKLVFEASSAN